MILNVNLWGIFFNNKAMFRKISSSIPGKKASHSQVFALRRRLYYNKTFSFSIGDSEERPLLERLISLYSDRVISGFQNIFNMFNMEHAEEAVRSKK